MFARALVVLLVVLNLGVGAWWLLRPEASADATPGLPADADVPRLQLLSEVPADQRPGGARNASRGAVPEPSAAAQVVTQQPAAAQAAAGQDAPADEASAAVEASARCYTAGPFADPDAVAAARARLQALGAPSEPRSDAPARGGTWSVSIAPQADRASAQALGERIAAAGFSDYYVVADGALANAIALGRFGNQAAAERHRDALAAAGFAAQVQPPPGARPRQWLDVRTAQAFDPAAAGTAIGSPLRAVACATPG